MKEHFCPAEQSIISYQDQCNWCGEQESKIGCVNHDCDKCKAQTQEPDDIASILACRDMLDAQPVPPQRTWVGLTDEEENEYNYLGPDMYWVIQEISAKLKEKNT